MTRIVELPASSRNRLAVLTAHLTAVDPGDLSASPTTLHRNCVSAQTFVPPPGNLKGTITVVDERTGKKYQIDVSEDGTIKATDLKKVISISPPEINQL